MNADILISNPLLDYAYTRQDVENMVIATTRSHKDSETYTPIGDTFSNRFSSRIWKMNVIVIMISRRAV